jgi:hypothetical protein
VNALLIGGMQQFRLGDKRLGVGSSMVSAGQARVDAARLAPLTAVEEMGAAGALGDIEPLIQDGVAWQTLAAAQPVRSGSVIEPRPAAAEGAFCSAFMRAALSQ